MAKIPAKVCARLIEGLKRFQPVVTSAQTRDLNEADTSRIVTDVLADVFGYDKYSEITSEFSIRNTYCDLAVKLNGKPKLLIEVKAVGIELKDNHIKQAVDYAANQGMDWVVLTNGVIWQVFKIIFGKPVDKEEVVSFNVTELNPKSDSDIEMLFLLAKEGLTNSALAEYHAQVKAVNRFTLSAIIQSDPITKSLRRELSRLSPDVKISLEDVQEVLVNEVLKREVVDAEEAKEAVRRVQREQAKLDKAKIIRDGVEGEKSDSVAAAGNSASNSTDDISDT